MIIKLLVPKLVGGKSYKKDDIITVTDSYGLMLVGNNEATVYVENLSPVPISVSSLPLPAEAATSVKQDELIEEISNKDIMIALKALLVAIANPSYVDKSLNQIRAVVTGTVTSSTTVAISDMTLKGTLQPRTEVLSNNLGAWSNVVRNKIS